MTIGDGVMDLDFLPAALVPNAPILSLIEITGT